MRQVEESVLLDYFDRQGWFAYINQPGIDNEKPVIVCNWNDIPQAMMDYLKHYYELDWEDESESCCVCYGHIHTSPHSYGDQMRHTRFNDGEVICKDCALEASNTRALLEDATFWSDTPPVYHNALPTWLICKLEENGYVPLHVEHAGCKELFESGFHYGQNDTPEKVVKLVTEELGPREMLFVIDGSGQFDVQFSAYLKKKEV